MKTWENWQTGLQKGVFAPVLALGGEERALVDEAVLEIRQRVVTSGLADFNYDKVDGKEEPLDSILAKANTTPMMATLRLVEVRDADHINSAQEEILEKYLLSPSPTTVLVLVFQQLDQRQKIIKLLDKHAEIYKFSPLRESEIGKFVESRAQKMGVKLDREAMSLLIALVGDDLLLIDRALEKLQLAVDTVVTADDVALHVSSTRLEDAFRLGRAIAMGDRKDTIKSLLKLEAARDVPIRLTGLLAWQLRQVLRARVLLDQGMSQAEIGKSLMLFGDRQRMVISAAQKWPKEAHITRLMRLCQLDKELKSSRASSWHWLMRIAMQMCPISRAKI